MDSPPSHPYNSDKTHSSLNPNLYATTSSSFHRSHQHKENPIFRKCPFKNVTPHNPIPFIQCKSFQSFHLPEIFWELKCSSMQVSTLQNLSFWIDASGPFFMMLKLDQIKPEAFHLYLLLCCPEYICPQSLSWVVFVQQVHSILNKCSLLLNSYFLFGSWFSILLYFLF